MKTYSRQEIDPAKLALRLKRARSAVGRGILYSLGHGGTNPAAALPSDDEGLCDCSGFALAWVQGISREQGSRGKPWSKAIPWVNTDAAVKDARTAQRLFVPLDAPVPGCMVVYSKAMSGGEDFGHCGIVTAVQPNFDGTPGKLIGVDCHGGSRGRRIAAIEERDLSSFLARRAVFLVLKEDLKR